MKKFKRYRVNLILELFIIISIFMLNLSLVSNSQADPTREEEIARKQAEKAKHLAPYQPSGIEKYILDHPRLPILSPPIGLYPFIGSAYAGGGLALGPGYRKLYGDTGVFDLHGAYSIRSYKLVDGFLKLPDAAQGRVQSFIRASYIDANKVNFFGVGNDSLERNQTNFTYKPISVSLTENFRPVRWFTLGGGIEYLDIKTDRGTSSLHPSIEQLFTPATAPGLGLDPKYVVGNLLAQLDWRQSPGYTTAGGVYRVQVFDYNQRQGSNFDFRRVDMEGAQFLPILRANQIIALRALASFTDVTSTNDVPFFLLPKLGGSTELRGFRNFRFRDRNRLLLTAEYRWTPSKFIDMAIFYEAGKVAAQRSDLDLKDLHKSYGVGIRFHSFSYTALRFEVARSVEGTRFIFDGGPVF